MKNIIYKSYLLLGMMILASCSEDFLETQPLDKVSADAAWSDPALAEAAIFGAYSSLGYGGFEDNGLANITDQSLFTHAGRFNEVFTQGTETPGSLGFTSATYKWDDMYAAIRKTNIAIANLPETDFEAEVRDKLLGEAYFLRAYYYQQLWRFYGGVPLIEVAYELNEDYKVPRNTFSETADFIIADLDRAAELLDQKETGPGRASKIAAMALKARVLLYAASDLHDGNKVSAASAVLGGYSNLELIAYTSGDQNARWTAAKVAAKAVMDAASGYKLDLAGPVSPEEGKQNYVSVYLGGKSTVGDASAAVELLFQRVHSADYKQEDIWPLGGINFGLNNGPNGYHNWSTNTPLQLLVDDYEMMDGSKFDWDNPEHAKDPYADRDPRFYATILYDGADWKPRPSDVAPLDPVNQIQTGYYEGADGTINGLDTRSSTIENWNGSFTGYNLRKFIDPNPALADNLSNAQEIPWPFIRYTEVVLNYIEACIETGEEGEALAWLNKIRYRVGMPEVTDMGDALVERYRNERRIELAFEEHRYHDARRWLIPEETVGRPVTGINIRASLKPGATPHEPYRHDKDVYDYTYKVVNNTDKEIRVWDDKMYYRPIAREEVNKNDLLIQNPGY
ncbi:RagB/SusD family nutrient uptake outer membrane protein [Zobellia uliginosa]|uniref:RagB/SusD family nutrient uptake outer membrane protein n=1 Tax=Zobellia uliginosa TaxID=143224 RepID=UPI0026E4135B|nr:RagB/SusD family nutrient uptake outer membrane protein [Zobellia uliginosa]MDO6518617.1 RagB/SusD family nutrient uptake outer membrane protein [Zobellia uliginosa]